MRRKKSREPEPPPNDGLYAKVEGNAVDGYKVTVFDETSMLWEDKYYDDFMAPEDEQMARRRASRCLARERRRRATQIEDYVDV